MSQEQQEENRQRVAVIGAGAAGLITSYLLDTKHDVTLFEAAPRLGGHTNTITLDNGPDAGTPVDTGFIVLNDQTYPTLHRWFDRLGVAWRWSDMSFAMWDRESGFHYAGTTVNGLFAERQNVFSGKFWSFLSEIRRFCNRALFRLADGTLTGLSMGEFCREEQFSPGMLRDYLIPMSAMIWSSPESEMERFPAETFVRFFKNHGLLKFCNRPRWQTVVGGSSAYVRRFQELFSGKIVLSAGITGVERLSDRVLIHRESLPPESFDYVVFACHADQTLNLLLDPHEDERAAFGSWRYTKNQTFLHTDKRILPPNRRGWASWNALREGENCYPTYHMNRLQGLKTACEYLVTLNPPSWLDPKLIIREIEYTHPVYSAEAVSSQPKIRSLNGVRRSFYCGAYLGYGFHEDAVSSGVAVAKHFGCEL